MSLFASIFACGSSSHKKRTVPIAYCPTHAKFTVKFVCLDLDCKTPYLCSDCQSSHPDKHKYVLVPLKSLFNDQELIKYHNDLKPYYSSDYVMRAQDRTFKSISKIEAHLSKNMDKLREQTKISFARFRDAIENRRKVYLDYQEKSELFSKKTHISDECLNILMRSYERVKRDTWKPLDPILSTLPQDLLKEVRSAPSIPHKQPLSSLKKLENFGYNNFSGIQIRHMIPASRVTIGILRNACAFIPKLNLVAIGIREQDHLGSLALYDPATHRIKPQHWNHHICVSSIIYIEEKDYILACSENSSNIQVYKVSIRDKVLKLAGILRTYALGVGHMVYIKRSNLMIADGKDCSLMIWDMNSLRMIGRIQLSSSITLMEDIVSLPQSKLLGVPQSKVGFKVYNISKRSIEPDFVENNTYYRTFKDIIHNPKRRFLNSSQEISFSLNCGQLVVCNLESKILNSIKLPYFEARGYFMIPLNYGWIFLYNESKGETYLVG